MTRACGLVQHVPIAVSLSQPTTGLRGAARALIGEIAAEKRRYGYRRVHLRLRREGWAVNRKRIYRLYREAGLAVRRRKRKRIGPFERKPLPKPLAANLSWSMDFVVRRPGRWSAAALPDDRRRLHARMPGDRGRYLDHRHPRQGGARAPGRDARAAELDHRRSRPGVRRPGARCLGVPARRAACRSSGPASRTRTPTSRASTASSATSA